MVFCVPNAVYLWVSLSIFCGFNQIWTLKYRENRVMIIFFMASNILNILNKKKSARFERIFHQRFLIWNILKQLTLHFWPSWKPLGNEIGEAFSEGLKWTYKGEIDRNILKIFSSSQNCLNILLENLFRETLLNSIYSV